MLGAIPSHKFSTLAFDEIALSSLGHRCRIWPKLGTTLSKKGIPPNTPMPLDVAKHSFPAINPEANAY